MEWAKGLKDRVERTATGLSTAATTAFTPPDDEEVTTASLLDPAGTRSDAEGAAPLSSSSAQGGPAVLLSHLPVSVSADEDSGVGVQG